MKLKEIMNFMAPLKRSGAMFARLSLSYFHIWPG